MPSINASVDDKELLLQLWNSDNTNDSWFAPFYVKKITRAVIETTLSRARAVCGHAQRVVSGHQLGWFVVQTATHHVPIEFGRNPAGQIVLLRLGSSAPLHQTLAEILDEMKGFAAATSFRIERDGKVLAAVNDERKMAVGSAFKLVVLTALLEMIDAGHADWSDVSRLRQHHLSAGSGVLHRFPAGAPLTLHCLAALMISQSDNTATDCLIDYVGRDRLEAIGELQPFLATREVWLLKVDPRIYKTYKDSDLSVKRQILSDFCRMPLPKEADRRKPWLSDAEWLMSTKQLCRLMSDLADLDIMQINPGIAEPSRWRQVAFKSGGEIGVRSLTTAMVDDAGHRYCVAATWNDSNALDEKAIRRAYGNLLEKMRMSSTNS